MARADRTAPADAVARILDEWRVQRPDLDPSPMGVLGRIARVHSLQRAGLATLLSEHSLSLSSFDVLANLRRSAPPHRKTPSELAVSSMISTGGITFRLDRLETDGLITRVRDTDDRRVWYAELTPAGIELIDRVVEQHLEREHAIVNALTPAERAELARMLATLERSLDRVDGAPSAPDEDPTPPPRRRQRRSSSSQ